MGNNLEEKLIELAIYYVLANSKKNEILELSACTEILKKELEIIKENKTIFKVDCEHIINKLAQNFVDMKKDEYENMINIVILKINYYDYLIKEIPLMNIASEKDVTELANEIIYFNMGFEDLKKESQINKDAMYELGVRYDCAKMYKEAYNCFEIASKSNHKKAKYCKALCLCLGSGINKNEELAFKEIYQLCNSNEIYTKAKKLMGKMYYYGKGIEQNYKKAFECFEDVKDEEKTAQYYIGKMYLKGYGVKKNKKLGKKYIINSAKLGCKKAIMYIIENGTFK